MNKAIALVIVSFVWCNVATLLCPSSYGFPTGPVGNGLASSGAAFAALSSGLIFWRLARSTAERVIAVVAAVPVGLFLEVAALLVLFYARAASS